MTFGLSLVALAVAAGTATCLLIIREIHLRALDTQRHRRSVYFADARDHQRESAAAHYALCWS